MAEQRASHRIVQNIFYSLYNKAIAFGLTFFTSVYVARTLGPNQLGIYSYVLWFVSIVTILLGMGFMTSLTKYVAELEHQDRYNYIQGLMNYVLRIEIVLSIGATIPLLIFNRQIADLSFSPGEGVFFFLAFLGILPGMATAVLSSSLQGLQQFVWFTRFSMTISPLSMVAKLAVLYLGYNICGLLIVQLCFSVINLICFAMVLGRKGIRISLTQGCMDKDLKKRFIKFNFTTFSIIIFDFIIWDKSETFFLGRFCSSSQIAFYTLPFNIVKRFMGTLPEIFWEVLLPAMSGFYGKGDEYRLKRTYYLACRYIAFASWPVGVAGIILAYPLLRYIYGVEYIGAENVLQILFFASIIVSLDAPSGALYFASERQSFIIKISAVLAALNLIMDFFLIPRYGAYGAAICNGTVQIIGSLIGLFYVYRIFGYAYPIKSVSKIAFSSLFMGIVMLIIFKTKPTLLGFVLALTAGPFVYLISCIVLGSFEEEDVEIFNRITRIAPRPLSRILVVFMKYILQQKTQY